MIERPIRFNDAMVRAILDGRKTQTRRPVKPQPVVSESEARVLPAAREGGQIDVTCPYGKPGDRLWVQERSRLAETDDGSPFVSGVRPNARVRVRYEADETFSGWLPYPDRLSYVRAGRFLPNGCYREASRITLEITDVRVERVQDISEADAIAEGIERRNDYETIEEHGSPMYRRAPVSPTDRIERWTSCPVAAFESLWNSIYAAKGFGWDANPWVWVVKLRRVEVS